MPDLLTDAYDEAPTAEADWPLDRPLTPGQQMDVDYLLSFVTDTLARDVLITLKRDGLPPKSQWKDFMAQYALWTWDATSDAIAWATLAKIANSDWDETLAYADDDHVETVAQDQGDDRIEGLVIINAETGDILLDRTGVVRADGSQYVGLQDYEVEALQGLELIFVHNHPNGSDASEEDLDSAFRADAELLIVITPQGQEFVYIRGRNGMVKVRDEEASYEVGLENPEETVELSIRSEEQAAAFEVDSPELIFLQEDPNQLQNDIYVPISATADQAARMFGNVFIEIPGGTYAEVNYSEWMDSWIENPEDWPEFEELKGLFDSKIIDVARKWNHPAFGMSEYALAVLIVAHLRQEGHYRGEGGVGNEGKNIFSSIFLGGNPSVGPANLRVSVVDEILGTHEIAPHIPMPDTFPQDPIPFDDEDRLNELEQRWRNLDQEGRENLLKEDAIAIELTAANINRGVERLFRQYLFDEHGIETEDQIQDHLKERGLQRSDLVQEYLQQEEFRVSMFNMLAWVSQGIAESHTLSTGETGPIGNAGRHASGGVRSINTILAMGQETFGLPPYWGDVRMFNDADTYAYRDI